MFDAGEKQKMNKPSIEIHKSQTNLDILNKFNHKINQVIFKYNSFHFPENSKNNGDKKVFTTKQSPQKKSQNNFMKSLSLEHNHRNQKSMKLLSIKNLRKTSDKILSTPVKKIK
jgi:hypothetical protein